MCSSDLTKGRFKGPVDFDKQCGVINDKGLNCSRSLTCKSHSMGAKRAVEGRSKPYDELLLEWNRLNNPNFVEPVKRESKAEKKAKKDKEKAEKKKQQMEAAAALANDPNAPKKASGGGGGTGTKKTKKGTGTTTTTSATVAVAGSGPIVSNDNDENIDDLDSEEEVDALVQAIRVAHDRGVMSVPLAVPSDAGSWFVARRERVRTCRELLANALMPARTGPPGVSAPGRMLG